MTEERRQIFGRVVAEKVAPVPVDANGRLGARRGHPPIASDNRDDLSLLGAKPPVSH